MLFWGWSPGQNTTGQNTDSLVIKADALFNDAREMEALELYNQVLRQDEEHFRALWRISLILAREGYRQSEERDKAEYYREALRYAEKVLDLYPDEGYAHFVYAVANGRMSDVSRNNKRIELSHVVKKHAEKAIELVPEYGPAWHLLGLWHSKVANTGKGKKLVASVFSGGLPEGASNDKAEEYILKAIELDPSQSIRYRLDLGRHYQRAGENGKAREALQKVIDEDAKNKFDRMNKQEARKILDEIG